jgi:F0F1-type ATP synthase membrane subunit a
MGLLECIVAFIQAFVFTLLTAMFTGMAMPAEHAVEHK